MILFWGLNVRFARQQFFYRWRKKIGQAGGIVDSKAFLGLRDLAIIATFPLSCVLFESEKLASVISSFSTFAILIISIYIPSLFSFSVSWKNIVIWIIYTGHICLNFYPSCSKFSPRPQPSLFFSHATHQHCLHRTFCKRTTYENKVRARDKN